MAKRTLHEIMKLKRAQRARRWASDDRRQRSAMAKVPERLRSLPLETARYWRDQGLMSEKEWEAYAHAWQQGGRLHTRVCNCSYCKSRYSHLKLTR